MKRQRRKLGGVAAILLLLLAAILAAPFLLTTQLVRLALWQVFPANSPSVGSAVLHPSGTLVLHDLALHDTGTLAQQPLVTARELDVAFGWAELLSRHIRRIHAEDVTIYARSNGPRQLSLLDLLFERSQSGPPAHSNRGSPPLRIDTLNAQGMIYLEPVTGLVPVTGHWPLALQMTMSGDPLEPARQLRVAIGATQQLLKKISEKPSVAVTQSPSSADTFSLRADLDTQPAAGGTRIVLHSLAVRQAALTLDADTLRQYVAKLPAELQGRIETSIGNLTASGELELRGSANGRRLTGNLTFADLRLRMLDSSPVRLSLDDLAGAAEINTLLPLGPQTAITIKQLQAKNTKALIEADVLRRYATKLPADLYGLIDANLGALNVSGLIGSRPGDATGFTGNIRLQDLSVHLPVSGKLAVTLDRLTAAGRVESRLDRWVPTALKVGDGTMQWAALTYSNNALNNLDASWHIADQMLISDRYTAQIFDGHLNGSLVWDLGTHTMSRCNFRIQSINMHEALANISPKHLDAEGNASGSLQLVLNKESQLSGYVDLAFDGPGILKIGEIEEVERMLVGNFGLALASLAMRDLRHYPFKEGRLYLESLGDNAQLKVNFVRQPRTEADRVPPRKEIINGREIWVGSLVVPTIDLTIPITGKSLAEVLSLVSGFHPLIEAVSEQRGK